MQARIVCEFRKLVVRESPCVPGFPDTLTRKGKRAVYATRISATVARAAPPEMFGLIVSSRTVTPLRLTQ